VTPPRFIVVQKRGDGLPTHRPKKVFLGGFAYFFISLLAPGVLPCPPLCLPCAHPGPTAAHCCPTGSPGGQQWGSSGAAVGIPGPSLAPPSPPLPPTALIIGAKQIHWGPRGAAGGGKAPPLGSRHLPPMSPEAKWNSSVPNT